MSRHISWLLILFSLVLLAGCGSDNSDTNTSGTNPRITPEGTATVFAKFDAVYLPLPNDVTWAAVDQDKTDSISPVYLPLANDGSDMDQLKTLINAQGILGLSPNMFLTVPLTGAVSSDSLTNDLTVLVFRIDVASPLEMDVRTKNNFVIVNDSDVNIVKLLPKTPFIPGARYAVVVKTGVKDSNQYEVKSSFTMNALKVDNPRVPTDPDYAPIYTAPPYEKFEALRAAFNEGDGVSPGLFDVVASVTNTLFGTPWTRSDVLVMWTFHTASNTLSLTPTSTILPTTVDYPIGTSNGFTDTSAYFYGVSGSFPDAYNAFTWVDPLDSTNTSTTASRPQTADAFFTGYLSGAYSAVPYTAIGNVYAGTFLSPNLGQNPAVDGDETLTVNFRLITPQGLGPWPVVLFQHGITSSKDAALPIANTLAAKGYAVLAIDAIYHGERKTPGANSGDGFFTTNLLQDRANLYQSAVDLWEAADVITAGIDVDGDTNPDLSSGSIEFMAHSLGSIIGSVFLSQETRVDQMVLSSPSALLVNVLDETALSDLRALVTSLGYTPGTTEYYVFLNLAQWLLDPADATYMGIGINSPANLLNVFAYDDPIVTPTSTQVFMTNIGLDPASTIAVDPDAGTVATSAGTYQYGVSDKPVVHSFLLSPLINRTTETYYATYNDTVQSNATQLAQGQVFNFLFAP